MRKRLNAFTCGCVAIDLGGEKLVLVAKKEEHDPGICARLAGMTPESSFEWGNYENLKRQDQSALA